LSDTVTLWIDGREVKAPSGATILQAALGAGIDIPNLCYDPRLEPTGQCKLCIVRVEGCPEPVTSCTERVRDGMVVTTEDEEIRSLRRTTLELLLSEHRVRCTSCDAEGNCPLQDYAYRYGADETRYGTFEPAPRRPNYSDRSPGIRYDPQLCIRCERCVRYCQEVSQVAALTFVDRPPRVEVSTFYGDPLHETACVLCGGCIGTCPTGALWEKAAVGRGRARDLRKIRTTCPYCGVGCQMDLNVGSDGTIVRVTSEVGSIPNNGNLCVKGKFGMDFVGHADRLKTPLIREDGGFREASWEETLGLVAQRLGQIKQRYGADALAGLSSAKCTNEENYLFQKFMRAVVGTNNVDHCARLCHASTVAGLARAFGSGAMTNSIGELKGAGAIFVIGSNTTECHPVMGMLILQARRNGSTLIVADPRKIELARRAHLHLQHACGTDVALLNAMMRVMLEEDLWDRRFVESRCENFEAFRDEVLKVGLQEAAAITRVPAEDIRRAARLYAQAERASIVYSMGITQHTTGTDNVLSLANLAMLTGNVGRESTGVNPLRGQNNVQGACDLGALPDVYTGYQKVGDAAIRSKFERAWGVPLPGEPGLTVVEIIDAAARGAIKGLYILGENPMLSDPDITHVREALGNLEFLVCQDIFLSETARLADVVLPATCFAEKEGTFTNTERRVQRVRKAVEAPGGAREDWRIICDVAAAMGYPMSYSGPSQIMEEIASLTPIYGGISYERIERVGLQWPCPSRDHPGTRFLHREGFSRGRGRFHAVRFLPPRELPDEEFPLVLTTGRQLEHWHTGTMSRRCDVLDFLVPEGRVEVPEELAERYGISDGEKLRLRSRRGSVVATARVVDRPREDTVFLAFHFAEAPANVLTNPALDPVAKIPEYKVCAVSVERLAARGQE